MDSQLGHRSFPVRTVDLVDGYRASVAGRTRMQISIAQEGRSFEV